MHTEILGARSGDATYKRKAVYELGVLICGLVGLAGVWWPSCTHSPPEVNHLNRGNALDDKGDRDGAIAEYREALRVNPHYAKAHFNIGVELGRKGDLDGALAEYREAVRCDPDDAEAHHNIGGVLDEQGDVDGAIAEFRESLRLKPGYADRTPISPTS